MNESEQCTNGHNRIRKAERSWVKKFLYILRNGQAETAVAIMTNLNEFVRTTELLTGEALNEQDFDNASPTPTEKMRAMEELIRKTRELGQVTRNALQSGKGVRKGPESGTG
ncbi:MAG: hypothetical protein ABFD89_11430 [Bryobacteraceae bacterium]